MYFSASLLENREIIFNIWEHQTGVYGEVNYSFSCSFGGRKGLSRSTTCWLPCLHTGHSTGRCLQSSDFKSFFGSCDLRSSLYKLAQPQGAVPWTKEHFWVETEQVELTTSVTTRGLCLMFSWILMFPGSLFFPLGLCLMPDNTTLLWGLHRQPRNTAQTLLWGLDPGVLLG